MSLDDFLERFVVKFASRGGERYRRAPPAVFRNGIDCDKLSFFEQFDGAADGCLVQTSKRPDVIGAGGAFCRQE